MKHLLTAVTSHEAGAVIPPSLSAPLSPTVLTQIMRARDAAQELSEDGQEVYGIDLVCGAISASPLQLTAAGALSPYRAGTLEVEALSPGAGVLAELPPDDEAPDFWAAHRIDVRGLRVTETGLRLFAWTGGGTVRMESASIDIAELMTRLEAASPLN